MTTTITYADYEASRQMSAILAGEPGYSPSLNTGAWVELLRPIYSGSSGVVVLAVDYRSILPHVGSSSFIVDRKTAQPRTPKLTESKASTEFRGLISLPVVEQVREVLAALSLNKSQLAQILGVTRPSIYAWFQGKEPNAANIGRLHTLLRTLARACVSGARPLNARFVQQSTELDAPSILDMLVAQELDENRIVEALERSRTLADDASRRRTTREERLRELGFEAPTRGERKERLAKNMALKDWPKQ